MPAKCGGKAQLFEAPQQLSAIQGLFAGGTAYSIVPARGKPESQCDPGKAPCGSPCCRPRGDSRVLMMPVTAKQQTPVANRFSALGIDRQDPEEDGEEKEKERGCTWKDVDSIVNDEGKRMIKTAKV